MKERAYQRQECKTYSDHKWFCSHWKHTKVSERAKHDRFNTGRNGNCTQRIAE